VGSRLLGGSSAPAYKFEEIGAGFDDALIIDARDVQQNDHDSKLPLYWPPAGSASRRPTTDSTDARTGEALDPVMQLRIIVDTGIIDPTIEFDDGHRAVYLRAQALAALRADLKRTRSRDVEPGGRLSMRLDDQERVDPATGRKRGIPKNIYSVSYEPPSPVPDNEPDEAPTLARAAERRAQGHQERLKEAVAARGARTDEPPF
jgi:hypothetical protein